VSEVSTVAVIGAGTLGRSIAHMAALGGYRTILEDLLPSSLRKAAHDFRNNLDWATSSGNVSAGEAGSAFARLEFADSVEEAAREADVVIEALPGDLESKSEIFILLDKVCLPATLLVTTTTTLGVTQLADVTYRQDKCAGMRFGQTAEWPDRLEIIRGCKTSDDTLAAVLTVAKKMRSDVVVFAEAETFSPVV
jgi:3-hydroxybutyryl-CoA dehydrogenase